jgi:hypothetical protein
MGDLMWNRDTFDSVFRGLHSPNLVISMKYGETDFFRYLPLNKLFFRSDHQKIIEFQARREYEGFGAYPSFVGWDCEQYLRQLAGARNVIGASVWCQTGGWGKRRQLTFIRHSSIWVELNAFVIARLWQGRSCEGAIEEFCGRQSPKIPTGPFTEFLRLCDEVIRKLLYIRELGERKIFFRRVRLPPQLFVFWDRILVNHTIKRVLGCLIEKPEQCLREAHEALEALERMRQLAAAHGLPQKGLAFHYDTFRVLAEAREYYFRPFTREVAQRLMAMSNTYRARYRRHYAVTLDFSRARIRREDLRRFIAMVFRYRRGYRIIDQVVTLRVLSWVYPLLRRWRRWLTPEFATRQTMGLDVLLK